MQLYKFTKAVISGKTYYNLRIPREIAESFDADQKFVVEKNGDNVVQIKPVTITV